MARRKDNLFEDLFLIASRLPWWLSFLIAVASWYALHGYANSPLPVVSNLQQANDQLLRTLLHGLAIVAQYAMPAIFAVGAIASLLGRARRKRLHRDVAHASQSGRTLQNISWREFEALVGEHFRRQGFSVSETGGNGPDGGVDLRLRRNAETYLVQCKQWRAFKVGVPVIREFLGTLVAEGATGGFVVCAGSFTADARRFAAGRNIQLIEGPELQRWIAANGHRPSTPVEPGPKKPAITPAAEPNCPLCQSPMLRRIAKRGPNAGQAFWGCSSWPECKGTR